MKKEETSLERFSNDIPTSLEPPEKGFTAITITSFGVKKEGESCGGFHTSANGAVSDFLKMWTGYGFKGWRSPPVLASQDYIQTDLIGLNKETPVFNVRLYRVVARAWVKSSDFIAIEYNA